MLVFWGSVQQGMDGFSHNPVDYATHVECPVLLMHGELDSRVTMDELQAIFAQLPGEKEFVLFPTAAHESYLGVDPQRWKNSIVEFCNRF